MAINLENVKKKLADIQQNETRKQSISDFLWKAPIGKSVIRFVPSQFNPEWPFLEIYQYFGLAKYPITSPITHGEADPIIEFAEALRKTGDKDNRTLAGKIMPAKRIYAPIIIRGKEDEGIKYWSFSPTIYKELLAILDDEDYGDITDLLQGRDITVEHFDKADTGKTMDSYNIRPKPAITPASNDPNILEKIKTGQRGLEDLLKAPTYQELEEILQKYLDSKDEEDGDNGETPHEVSTPTATVADVEAKFKSLFEDKKPSKKK